MRIKDGKRAVNMARVYPFSPLGLFSYGGPCHGSAVLDAFVLCCFVARFCVFHPRFLVLVADFREPWALRENSLAQSSSMPCASTDIAVHIAAVLWMALFARVYVSPFCLSLVAV
eukprot:RCo046344